MADAYTSPGDQQPWPVAQSSHAGGRGCDFTALAHWFFSQVESLLMRSLSTRTGKDSLHSCSLLHVCRPENDQSEPMTLPPFPPIVWVRCRKEPCTRGAKRRSFPADRQPSPESCAFSTVVRQPDPSLTPNGNALPHAVFATGHSMFSHCNISRVMSSLTGYKSSLLQVKLPLNGSGSPRRGR